MSERLGVDTLFGGDVTGFVEAEGPRLSEAIFRSLSDPDSTETYSTALQELDRLREISKKYGLSAVEYAQVLSYCCDNFLEVEEGVPFIDTEAGQETYMGQRPTVVFGRGQGADALAWLTAQFGLAS